MDSATLLLVAATALLNAGFAWLTGSLLARVWLAESWPQLPQRLRVPDGAAALTCLLGGAGVLLAAAARMGDTGLADAVSMWWPVAAGTDFGRATMLALGSVMAVAVCLRLRAPAGWSAAGLLAFALARASVSHGAEGGLLAPGFAVEVTHLLLVAVWLGAVALAAWTILPAGQGEGGAGGRYLDRLSRTATIALAGIVASGVWNSWQRLGAPQDLWSHPYGMLLSLKLALFTLAALLGGWNRVAGFPRARSGAKDAAMRVLRIESVALLAALVAAAALASQQPPG